MRGSLLFAGVLAVPAAIGCTSVPPGATAVGALSIEGAERVDERAIAKRLATAPSPKFLGVFPGLVHEPELFDAAVLERDLERVERFYRARGFYEARVRAARLADDDARRVDVTIVVHEGSPTVVQDLRIEGLARLPETAERAVRRAIAAHVPTDRRFDEEAFARAEQAALRALHDEGYAFAKVTRAAEVDLAARTARVRFVVEPDEPATLGAILIEGLGALPDAPVRRTLNLVPGQRFSTVDLDDAQRAALDLGVFRSVRVEPVLADPPPPSRTVPVRVVVEPMELRTVALGGGVQVDPIRTDVHAQATWEDRNFLGGLRRFEIAARPGLVLYPTRIPSLEWPTAYLPEGRLRAQLTQPGFLEARTRGLLRAEISAYPLLLSPRVDSDDQLLGYREIRGGLALERAFGRVLVRPGYAVQWDVPFAYLGDGDASLTGVVASYVHVLAQIDHRNDVIEPRRGWLLGADVQLAGGVLGGDAEDVRLQPEARVYLPAGSVLTLAARATVGFLLPRSYGASLEKRGGRGASGASPRERARDVQLVFLRGFFSGGPSSNRGYPLRGIGPHGAVPFYHPGVAPRSLALACDRVGAVQDDPRCATPLGGLSLWEASLETRFRVAGPFSTTLFCDASDVSAERLDLRLDRPHLSCGFGIRYATPIGPLRFDVGYRVPRLQGGTGTGREEPEPPPIFDLPIAIAIGLGEAF